VKFNDVDMDAFRATAQPLLDEYRRDPAVDALYQRIRRLA
jgi:hypothetical protein